MRYDVVLVLYNSAGWLPGCIKALASLQYPLSKLNIIAVDNASTDNSAALFEQLTQNAGFGGATLVRSRKNSGFGAACNLGAAAGQASYVLFLNVDTEIMPTAFIEIDRGIAAQPQAGGFECRQLPYEMGHHVDPVTLETPWASGAAMVVQRDIFMQAGQFDPHIFMYCEDVDLSCRIRATGHPLYYLPRAIVIHHVLQRENSQTSELREYAGSELGCLLLAYKYGKFSDIRKENARYLRELKQPRHYDGVRRVFAKNYLRHLIQLWPFLFWRFKHGNLYTNAPYTSGDTFAPERGREILCAPLETGPLISIVVRTHKRTGALRGALTSIAHQTYKNYEVVVVEDGEDCSREMVQAEFSHLPLRYYATQENIGRGRAGNFGLEQARGDYLNFLDDDDYFYPDHLELMAQKAMQHPEADLVLGCAMVMKVDVQSREPYEYTQRELYSMRFDRLDIFTMCQTCQIPIQSAMFKKTLFRAHGGLREDIEGHEDWAMWMRFLKEGKRIDPKHIDIHRATSIFVLPAQAEAEKRRLEQYRIYDEIFFNDPSVCFTLTMAELRGFYDDMIADTLHLQNTKKLDDYLRQQLQTRSAKTEKPEK